MQMNTLRIVLALLVAVPTVVGAERTDRIIATLSGYEEVPAVSTVANGRFRGTINHDDQSIDYVLRFSGLQGTVQQSHIHFAQKGVNGSIVIWLCQTATTPAPAAVTALTPFCVQDVAITGTITAVNVLAAGTASQQINAGELAPGRRGVCQCALDASDARGRDTRPDSRVGRQTRRRETR